MRLIGELTCRFRDHVWVKVPSASHKLFYMCERCGDVMSVTDTRAGGSAHG